MVSRTPVPTACENICSVFRFNDPDMAMHEDARHCKLHFVPSVVITLKYRGSTGSTNPTIDQHLHFSDT